MNRLISREQFAEIATGAVIDVSEVAFETLREAAYAMFDEKLDTIGSGMTSVRQVVSLLRFGCTEALRKPFQVSQDLFDGATASRRIMAQIYDDADGLPSPRRGRSTGPRRTVQNVLTLEPIATGRSPVSRPRAGGPVASFAASAPRPFYPQVAMGDRPSGPGGRPGSHCTPEVQPMT